MSTQAIFYQEVIPVSAKRHAEAAVKTGTDYRFARKTNAVPVTAVEFASAAREYAIVFAGKEDAVMPMVVLGARQDENAYVDDEGRWKARYVPAYIRRYPFVFSSSDDGATFTLCIDESFTGYNTDGRGERLFDADGERTQYLSTVLNFQQEYQAHFSTTQAFCRRLKELELLEPVEARFGQAGGRLHTLTGLLVINREKLRRLTDEQLAAMVRGGELELAYLHLHSLHHLQGLGQSFGVEAEAATASGAAPEPEVEPATSGNDGDAAATGLPANDEGTNMTH